MPRGCTILVGLRLGHHGIAFGVPIHLRPAHFVDEQSGFRLLGIIGQFAVPSALAGIGETDIVEVTLLAQH